MKKCCSPYFLGKESRGGGRDRMLGARNGEKKVTKVDKMSIKLI